MTRTLIFQGFTIAAYALVAASCGAESAKGILDTAIGLSSALIAYMTMRGIGASQVQRTYLKDFWAAHSPTRFFPEPFLVNTTSSRGRLPSETIGLVLIAMWIILFMTQLWSGDGRSTKVQLVSPIIVSASTGSGLKARQLIWDRLRGSQATGPC